MCVQDLNRQRRIIATLSGAVVIASSGSKIVMPLGMVTVAEVPAIGGFFALVAFLLVAVAAAVTLFVLAMRRGFWVEKKGFLAVLGVLVVGAAVGAAYWTLISTGYQGFGYAKDFPNVPSRTVDILGRVSNLDALAVVVILYAAAVSGSR